MNDQAEHYLTVAYTKAFGSRDEASWDSSTGYAPNRARMRTLYDYYRDVYLANPTLFLWAGLGRMAGAVIVAGLDILLPDPGIETNGFVEIAKSIFHDLAWQFEAVQDNPETAITLLSAYDAESPKRRSYSAAWTKILTGDPVQTAEGNRDLLENEQFSIVQPFYDKIKAEAQDPLTLASPFTNSIHPYHRDFLVDLPTGDITIANDRWTWITLPGGMWEKWAESHGTPELPIVMSEAERTRLVCLSLDDLMHRNFAPVDPALLPPGANDEA